MRQSGQSLSSRRFILDLDSFVVNYRRSHLIFYGFIF